MLIRGLRAARLTVRAAWLTGTGGLLGIVAVPMLLALLGHQVYVVSGASMQPTIPLGSIVVVHPVNPASIRVGEIVTFRLPHGTVVTHRVTGIAAGGELTFTTKGDASLAPDPQPVPASAVVGGVEFALPLAGLLLYALGSTGAGVLAVVILCCLAALGWSIERALAGFAPQVRITSAPGGGG